LTLYNAFFKSPLNKVFYTSFTEKELVFGSLYADDATIFMAQLREDISILA
jgi:hypothetical protein